jgi:hypothetical protein
MLRDRLPELAHSAAESPAKFWEPLGSENEQQRYEEQCDVGGARQSNHVCLPFERAIQTQVAPTVFEFQGRFGPA